MPPFLLACLAYLSVALPASTLGLLWPSMRLSFGEPVGALGILLVFGITASVISSVATGRLPVRMGPLVAVGTMLTAVALAVEAFAPSLSVMAVGTVLFGLGFGGSTPSSTRTPPGTSVRGTSTGCTPATGSAPLSGHWW